MIEGDVDISRAVEKLARTSSAISGAINTALFVGGLKVEEEAKKSIQQGNKTGRTYQRGSITHKASAPGQAPATDTGRLVNSIKTDNDEARGVVTVSAGAGLVDYVSSLEFGTKNMAARPFMKPALKKAMRAIEQRVAQGVKKVTDGMNR